MRTNWVVGSFTTAAFWLTLGASGALAPPVMPHNRPIDEFHHWSDKELAAMIERSGSIFLSDHEFFFIQELNRAASGEAERHDLWNDYFVIQQGTGVLTYGGKEVGGKEKGMGEWRGGKIEGGKTITLYPGELVVIPAGMPHLVTLQPGKNLRYLVFKARQ